ncbi:MAG: exodeoxyribonuclease V subunit gamma [Anaerolineales bacterium]|nr:exodeoxyribonuclease V subunit gamma [Anaerolineales bacterium]
MTAELWIGPAASGKTTACIRLVREVKAQDPLAPVTMLLPDRRQAASFRRRLAFDGGTIHAEVGTFGDLYREVLLLSGQHVMLASDPVILRILRTCIDQALQSGRLVYFAPIAHRPGFLKMLHDRFGELQRADLVPDPFRQTAAGRGPALEEMAELYTLYQQTMRDLGWDDLYSMNQRALQVLRSTPGVIQHLKAVVVDGFESFNPAQVEALALAANQVRQLVVTLPGQVDWQRVVFYRFEKAASLLQERIPDLQIHSPRQETYLTGPLKAIERDLFESVIEPFSGKADVRMLEARSPVEEARQALRWVKARKIRNDVRLFDCAILVPEIERYRPLLVEAAAEFHVPIRFTQGSVLLSSPPIAALMDFLHLPVFNWPRQLVLDSLHSPYLDFPAAGTIDRITDRLEEVSMFGQVVEGLSQWEETLQRLAAADPDKVQPDRLSLQDLPSGEDAKELWAYLEQLASFLHPPETGTTTAWVTWLEDLLEQVSFFKNCESSLDQAAALELREVLRSLVLAEHVAGDQTESYADFLQELEAVLETTSFQEKVDWKQPAVQVLTLLEARGMRYKAVAVLGLAEGIFPGIEREDPFLDETIRRDLGLEPRIERSQEGLFYLALTRSDRFLLLTRPTLAEDGETWEPSAYWQMVSQILLEKPIEFPSGAPEQLEFAASEQEFLFRLVQNGGIPGDFFGGLESRWEQLQFTSSILQERLARIPAGLHEGDLTEAAPMLTERFGPSHVWSASRVEQYAQCPFEFFAGSILGLEAQEPPVPGMDAAQLGSLLHAVLEETYKLAEDPSDPGSVLQALEKISAESFEAAPLTYGFRPTAYWELEKSEFKAILENVIRVLGERQRSSGWVPRVYEAFFGMRGAPPLQVKDQDDIFLFRGLIDRVDVSTEGELCIIDYKTGSSHLSKRDLVESRRLQLPLYAMAASDCLKLGQTTEGLYWALRRNEAGSLLLSSFRAELDGKEYSGIQGALQLAREHAGRHIRSIRAGKFHPQPPSDGCPSYCPAAAWCWRFNPGRWK